MNKLETGNLENILTGCEKNDHRSQKLLYRKFFGYAMSVCIRYTDDYDNAMEVVNDAFMKVYTNVRKYDRLRSFKSWFRRILINASIDHIKKEMRHQNQISIEKADLRYSQVSPVQDLSHEDLIQLIQNLSPGYRSVFNLYVIDGYNHEEISDLLGISTGTSKSNLSKARLKLREMLMKIEKDEYARIAR